LHLAEPCLELGWLLMVKGGILTSGKSGEIGRKTTRLWAFVA